MITQVVKCDRCLKSQERGAPLPTGSSDIMEVRLSGSGTKHLCPACIEAEAALLAKSVFGPAMQMSQFSPWVDEE